MQSFFSDMGEGDRVVAHVGTHSIDLVPEGRPDVSLSLTINDIGYGESADVLEEYILAINAALKLAHRRLRLERVFDHHGEEVVFEGEVSFEGLVEEEGRREEENPEDPLYAKRFVFIFEALPNPTLRDRHMMP